MADEVWWTEQRRKVRDGEALVGAERAQKLVGGNVIRLDEVLPLFRLGAKTM